MVKSQEISMISRNWKKQSKEGTIGSSLFNMSCTILNNIKHSQEVISEKKKRLIFEFFCFLVILIMLVLSFYCFFVEYRLNDLSAKVEESHKRQRQLEDAIDRLWLRNNILEESLRDFSMKKHGKAKFSIENMSDPTDLQTVESLKQIMQPTSATVTSSLHSNNSHTGSKNNTLESISKGIRHRFRRTVEKNERTTRYRKDAKMMAAKGKKPTKKKTSLPFIHLENNSSANREKQTEEDKTFKFWKEAEWSSEMSKKNFKLDVPSGQVRVIKEGAYLVYAQVVYHDAIGRWAAGIIVNEVVKAKCLESEQLKDIEDYTPDKHSVFTQCSLVTVLYIKARQNVSIRCMYGQRTILTQPEFTFWGMIKLT